MPRRPFWDWTRNKKASQSMLKDRLEKDKSKKTPLENTIINWLLGLFMMIIFFYVVKTLF